MMHPRRIVAGNWKMQGSRQLVREMTSALTTLPANNIDIILFPPYVYLPDMAHQLEKQAIAFGGQNCSNHPQGAYTGEISAPMLAEMGCCYVIVGHSERRTLYHETDDIVADKVLMALSENLTPILCIGETAAEREAGQALTVLKRQLNSIISLPKSALILSKLIIAYEPIWAIGTGKTATPELAQEIHSQIRQFLAQYAPPDEQPMALLYGGSVKADNAAQLIAMPDIDGFLVGGASLDPTQFVSICRAAIEGR